MRDGHSSGTPLARCLEQPTRTASLTSPCGVIAHRANAPRCRPYSVLLPVWFAMPHPLPDPRCALTAPFHPCLIRKIRRFVLCGTFPGVAPAGCYPAPYVDGARTFLSSHLSVIAGAAVQPTDTAVMGARDHGVKEINERLTSRPARWYRATSRRAAPATWLASNDQQCHRPGRAGNDAETR